MDITNQTKNTPTLILCVILLFACVLRFYNLGAYDLWFDELGTEMYTSQNLAKMAALHKTPILSFMLDRMKNDPHSFFYYFVIYGYSLLFGDGQSLRVLSVFFSMLSLIMFYKLSRLFFNSTTSLYALFLMAFNPFQLWYAQEARAYTMTCFFALWAIYIFFQAIKTDKRNYWILFPVTGLLSLFSSYNTVLLLVSSGVAVCFKTYRRHAKKWLCSILFILAITILFQFILSGQLNMVSHDFWIPKPTLPTLLHTWMFYTLGYSATMIQYKIALPVMFLLFFYGVFLLCKSSRVDTAILLTFLLLPVLLTYFISKTVMPIYIHRQLLIFSPFYFLFIARGLDGIPYKKVRFFIIICIGALMAASITNYYKGYMVYDGRHAYLLTGVFQKKNYSNLLDKLHGEYQEGDYIAAGDLQSYAITRAFMVKHFSGEDHDPFYSFGFFMFPARLYNFDKYYLDIHELVDSVPAKSNDEMHSFSLLPNGDRSVEMVHLNNTRFKNIWLITSGWYKDDYVEANSVAVQSFLRDDYNKTLLGKQDGVQIERYTRK